MLSTSKGWKSESSLSVPGNRTTDLLHTCETMRLTFQPTELTYKSSLSSSCSTTPCQLWKNVNILLRRSSLPALPSYDSLSLCVSLLLTSSLTNFTSSILVYLSIVFLSHHPPPFTLPNFSSVTCVTTDGVSKLLSQSPDTNCDLDPIPTSLLFTKPFFLCRYWKLYTSVFLLLYGVPQGSILGALLFILYTTPLSTVISNSSANHQLYADDTQLLLSFWALNFSHNITYLENTKTNVSNWMSSNFLSLNPSKTEFLIFGLPQQISKLNNTTIHRPNNVILSPVDSTRNLGVIFDYKSVICATYLFYF